MTASVSCGRATLRVSLLVGTIPVNCILSFSGFVRSLDDSLLRPRQSPFTIFRLVYMYGMPWSTFCGRSSRQSSLTCRRGVCCWYGGFASYL